MQTVEEISRAIMADPANQQYTAAGIEPLFHVEPTATILIISQAPSRQAQLARTYWHDPSGDRLRQWMGINADEFYTLAALRSSTWIFTIRARAKVATSRRGGDLLKSGTRRY